METAVFKMGSNAPKIGQTEKSFPTDEQKHLFLKAWQCK